MNRERAGSDSELLRGKQRHANYGTNSEGPKGPTAVNSPGTSRANYSPLRPTSFSPRAVSSPQQQPRYSPEVQSYLHGADHSYQFRPPQYVYRITTGPPPDDRVSETTTESEDESATMMTGRDTTPTVRSSANTRSSALTPSSPLTQTSARTRSSVFIRETAIDSPVESEKLDQTLTSPINEASISPTAQSPTITASPTGRTVTISGSLTDHTAEEHYGSLEEDVYGTTNKTQYGSNLETYAPETSEYSPTRDTLIDTQTLPREATPPTRATKASKVTVKSKKASSKGGGKGGGKPPYRCESFDLSSMSSECPCTLDAVLNNSIGPWGAWQMRISILASLLKFPIAWFQLGIVFLAPATDFWCARPPLGTIPKIDTMTPREWKTMIGCNMSDHQRNCLLHGSCYMHDPRAPLTNPPVPCLWGYEFDTSVYHSTIVTEWEMVCKRAKMIDLSQAVLMFGILLGTVILGITSDRIGRKPVLVTCLFVQTIAAVCSALAPTYTIFLITRFLMAFANAGTMVCSFVMCMEVVGGKWRTIVPVLYQIPFGVGNTIMALIAYFIRDWRYFQLAIALLSGIYWVYWKFMPESPRWLLATGRKERAVKLLENIARENGKTEEEIKNALRYIPSLVPLCKDNKPLSIKCLFNTPVILLKTCILCLHWFCAGISFYGFSQYMGQITSHLYAMVAIGGLISLPGTIICCFIIQKFGRRETIAGAHIFTAACYLGILMVPQGSQFADWPRVLFAALGVVGLAISTPALYLFSGELFPTVLRNAGIGVVMMCSRVGSMVAPFVTSLSTVTYWLPLFILSICVVVEALLVIPLPETKGAALPDTVAEAEAFTRKSTISPRCKTPIPRKK